MHAPARQPTALLIDAMGTLVRLASPAPLLVASLRDRLGVRVADADARRALRAEIDYYRAHMQDGRDADSLARLHARCAAVLRAALPEDPALARASSSAVTEALLASLRFVAFDDAREALVRVRAAGARVIAVSNWDVSLVEVLERCGLAPLLDGVVTSAAVGARKPAPEIFGHALAVAGVAGVDDAVHVGDSVADDVLGARACGIPAVLIDRDGTGSAGVPRGVPVIGGLDELAWPPPVDGP